MSGVDWPTYFRALREEKERKGPELVAPPPEHTSREPWPADFPVPSAPAALAREAGERGWLTRVQYARGSVVCRRKGPDGTMGRVIERRHSVAVVLWHPELKLHGVAVWEAREHHSLNGRLGWKADLAKAWKAGEVPHEVGVTALKEWIKNAG